MDKEIDSKKEWTPPKFINCIKFSIESFTDYTTTEKKVRDILNKNDITIKKINILNKTKYQFRKLYDIEIEEFKHDALKTLKASINENNKGVNLDIKYDTSIDKF